MILSLIRDLFRGGGIDMPGAAMNILALAFILFCCMPVHEFAHAWMANKLGDETPRLAGRLTLNPFAHLDLWGSLLILFVGIGYAKPVPVNPRNMRGGSRKGLAFTSLAGPVSNVILAFIAILLFNVLTFFGGNGLAVSYLSIFLEFVADINILLAAFNLIPLPPLDGFNILQAFLPYKALEFVSRYHDYIRWALLAAVLLGWLDIPLGLISAGISFVLSWVAGLPFMFFR